MFGLYLYQQNETKTQAMKRYNEVYKGVVKMWKEANDERKHVLVSQMFNYLSKSNKEQEKEYAILDFMDRWVFGTNVSVDCSSLKCERGFAHYKVSF